MEERQTRTVDVIATVGLDQPALVQVPVGDIPAGIPNDRVLEQRRNEVEPALVRVQLLLERSDAIPLEPLHPPREERSTGVTDCEKSRVEDPALHDDLFRRRLAISRERRQAVRWHDDSMRPRE